MRCRSAAGTQLLVTELSLKVSRTVKHDHGILESLQIYW
jgi:hypothetical protein